MISLKRRIEKLEKLRPKGFEALSNEELDKSIQKMQKLPEIQAFLVDFTDPLNARAVELLKIIGEYENL
ncbi:MAG: hypothetical protein LM517_02665 [Nitrosomonas sp.]|nr:hypothetical protein [Nitrosomonas sp.]